MCTGTYCGSKRRVEKSKNTDSIFPGLKYPQNSDLMAVAGRKAYFVHISKVAKTNILHHITYLLGTEAAPNLISKDFVPTHWLFETVKPTINPLYSASQDPLEILR